MTCVFSQTVTCATATAHEGDGAATELEQIDVVGRLREAGWLGASDGVYETPGSVAAIGRQAIDERGGARNAADLFRGVAGVDGVIDRQNPGLNVNIRGLQDQGRVNMSVDGARQNFQQSGHGATSFAYVDPELIGGIEIDKGPSSTAGGAGVIGGVVNFRTLDFDDIAPPDKRYGVRANGTTGTNAYDFNGSLAAAAKVSDAFEVVGAVGRKTLGEYEAGERGDLTYSGPGEPAAFTSQDQWSWLLKATARPTDDQVVKLAYTGLDAAFETGGGENTDANKVTTHNVIVDWRWAPESPWLDVSAKAYYARTENQQHRPARTSYGAFDIDYAIDTLGGSLSNAARFSTPAFDVAVTYGVEYFRDQTDTAATGADNPDGSWFSGSNPVGERGVGGGFARVELKRSDWLQLLVGGRYDRYDMTGATSVFDQNPAGARTDVDMSGGRFSPTATVAVTPVKGLQLYASYEQGFRPPNIMEAIIGGQHIGGGLPTLPNPDLKPEVSKTYEAGVNLKLDDLFAEGDAVRAKASIYTTKVENFITLSSYFLGQLLTRAVNLDDATRLRGLDLEANYDAGAFYIGGAAAFIDGRYGASFAAPPGATAPTLLGIYLSPNRKLALDAGLRFLERKLTVGGRVTAVKPEDQIGGLIGTYRYERYTLLDAYAIYKVNDAFTVRASVENIRDVAYVEAMGAPLSPSPGRTFTIGATARF